MIKVRFIKSPTGKFALGYSAGEVGVVPASIAEVLQREGYAEMVKEEVHTATNPIAKATEKATKKRN
jgi:hypothetical protein